MFGLTIQLKNTQTDKMIAKKHINKAKETLSCFRKKYSTMLVAEKSLSKVFDMTPKVERKYVLPLIRIIDYLNIGKYDSINYGFEETEDLFPAKDGLIPYWKHRVEELSEALFQMKYEYKKGNYQNVIDLFKNDFENISTIIADRYIEISI